MPRGDERVEVIPLVPDPGKPLLSMWGRVDVRRVDVRPVDVRPVDVRPVDVRPVDVRPVDVKAHGCKPKRIEHSELG
jgi:hypothetical protein